MYLSAVLPSISFNQDGITRAGITDGSITFDYNFSAGRNLIINFTIFRVYASNSSSSDGRYMPSYHRTVVEIPAGETEYTINTGTMYFQGFIAGDGGFNCTAEITFNITNSTITIKPLTSTQNFRLTYMVPVLFTVSTIL